MALIKCPKCGKQISELSKECLQCGFPIHNSEKPIEEKQAINASYNKVEPRKRKKVLIALGLVLGLVSIVAAIGIFWFSISPNGLLSLIGNQTKSISSSDSIVESKISDEWTIKNIPLDIMNRIKTGMNVEFLKKKMGEPQKVGQFDDQEYTWNCDCFDITVNSKGGRIETITYQWNNNCDGSKSYFLDTGLGDTIYFGKSTFDPSNDYYRFTISYNIHGFPAYFQEIMGNHSNDFTNYLLETENRMGYLGDALNISKGEEVTLDKLPTDLRISVIDAAKKTPIEKITVTQGM